MCDGLFDTGFIGHGYEDWYSKEIKWSGKL